MPTPTIGEKSVSKRMSGAGGQRLFSINYPTGSPQNSETQVLADFMAWLPTSIGTYQRVDADCEVEEVAQGVLWNGTAKFAPLTISFQQPGSFSVSFDVSGTTQRVMNSLATVGRYYSTTGPNALQAAKDFHGAIGVKPDGTIEGAEIIIPATVVTINTALGPTAVNPTWIGNLAGYVGRMNSQAFYGRDPGEYLLMGVAGQQRPDLFWNLSYRFGLSKNKLNFRIGGTLDDTGNIVGGIMVDKKIGWDYLWVSFADAEQTAGTGPTAITYTAPLAQQVNIERVYDVADMNDLNIVTLGG